MAHILVVDDNPDILEGFDELLSSWGHGVTTATNGVDGLDQIKRNAFDLVVTDMRMPTLGGAELIKEAKALRRTPVLAVSGEDTGEERLDPLYQARSIGADAVLRKPARARELRTAVEGLLAKRFRRPA